MAAVPRVEFRTVDGPYRAVSVKLGAGPPEWSGPGARWEVAERPLRDSISYYAGRDLRTLRIALLFDAFAQNASIDGNVDRLERLMEPLPGMGRPPRVRVYGPVRDWSQLFVLESVEYGDAVVMESGFRSRLECNVTLLEFQGPSLLVKSTGKKAKARNGQGGKGQRRTTYIVKQGDTLRSIAKKLLGDGSKASAIKSLNVGKYPRLRDPRHIKNLVGRTLKVPPHFR